MIVSGQYRFHFSSPESAPGFDLTAGVKLPTGKTDATNSAGEKAEVTIQPGTGSWDGIFGLNASFPLLTIRSLAGGVYSRLPLNASLSFRRNGRGTDEYKFGNQLMAHLGTEYAIFPRLSLLFQTNGRWQDFANTGTTGEFRSNTGGTWIFASPGVNFRFSNFLSAYSYAQVPVYQKVNGIQQAAPLNLQFGLVTDLQVLH